MRKAIKGRHLSRTAVFVSQALSPSGYRSLRLFEVAAGIEDFAGIKKVFIRSGIRYDYLMAGKYQEFLAELCEHHVSGQLKVAPEHVSRQVIDAMQKSGRESFLKFLDAFQRENKRLGKEQYLVPYLMCSHPGSSLQDAIELAEFLRDIGYHPEQVQEFIPTPGSLSAAMYYTAFIHSLESDFCPKTIEQRQTQRALLQYVIPKIAGWLRRRLKVPDALI